MRLWAKGGIASAAVGMALFAAAQAGSAPTREVIGWSPTHLAAAAGWTPVLDVLLRAGANPEVRSLRGRTPLYEAAKRGRVASARRLLSGGADIATRNSRHGFTALHGAAENRQMVMLDFLVQAGADVNARNTYGQTPLWQASWQAWHGDTAVAQFLVAHGAEVNAAARDGYANASSCAVRARTAHPIPRQSRRQPARDHF